MAIFIVRNYKNPMDRKHPILPPALSLPHQFFSPSPAIIFDFTSDKSFGLVYMDKICMARNTKVGRQRKLRKPPFPTPSAAVSF
jgi:hypothetical protein